MIRELSLPISPDAVRQLVIGEPVLLSGIMVTGRDTAHKWLFDTFIRKTRVPEGDDEAVHSELLRLMPGSLRYRYGPVGVTMDAKCIIGVVLCFYAPLIITIDFFMFS